MRRGKKKKRRTKGERMGGKEGIKGIIKKKGYNSGF